jgi:hypothetical protein
MGLPYHGQAYVCRNFFLEACPMKKLIGILLSFLIIYSVYYDITVGTLPFSKSEKAEAVEIQESSIPFFEAKVKSGETLITIVEHKTNKSLSVPISELIRDFMTLNQGQSPEKMQVGKIYRFPKYAK